MTMILPPDTGAFYFYAEPYMPFGSNFTITATSQNGTSGPVSVATTGGAQYYGFYAKGLDWVTSIKITSTAARRASRTHSASGSSASPATTRLSRSHVLPLGSHRQPVDVPSRSPTGRRRASPVRAHARIECPPAASGEGPSCLA